MIERGWTVRVTATDPEAANVVARRHQFAVGRPLDFDSQYAHVTALESVLGAIGAEIVNGLRVFAKRRRIDIYDIEAVVHGELDNPLTYLEVVGEEGHAGLSRVLVTVYVASPHEDDVLLALWRDTSGRLPLVLTFRAAVSLDVEFKFTAG
jgi:hypothetical protein